MTGVMNNVLSNGNHTTDNNTTIHSSSLSAAAAVAVASSCTVCVQFVYSIVCNQVRHNVRRIMYSPMGTI